MRLNTLNLKPEVHEYMLKYSLREPDVLTRLRLKCEKISGDFMSISPEQWQLMAMFIGILCAKKTLDIGTCTGYGALAIAYVLPNNGKVVSCDISSERLDVAQKYWNEANVDNKIDLRIAPMLETLQNLIDNRESETFDFAFINADYGNLIQYYEKSLTLLRHGGLIAINNELWGGQITDKYELYSDTNLICEEALKLHADDRVTISIVPIGGGLTLVRKR